MHRHRSLRPHPALAQGGAGRGRPRRRVGGLSLADATLRVPIARQPGAEDLPLPRRATAGASGFDLHAAVDAPLVLHPGARAVVPTGFSIAVPPGFEAQVRPRSGLALRDGVVLPNAPGTIDSDYRGEVKVILCNLGDAPFTVRRGDRVAQLVIAPVVNAEWEELPALDATARGAGGFGHTGRGSGADGGRGEGGSG